MQTVKSQMNRFLINFDDSYINCSANHPHPYREKLCTSPCRSFVKIEFVSFVCLKIYHGGHLEYITGIQLAKFELLIDTTSSIYLKVRLKGLATQTVLAAIM
jgi:hypothetical protein